MSPIRSYGLCTHVGTPHNFPSDGHYSLVLVKTFKTIPWVLLLLVGSYVVRRVKLIMSHEHINKRRSMVYDA